MTIQSKVLQKAAMSAIASHFANITASSASTGLSYENDSTSGTLSEFFMAPYVSKVSIAPSYGRRKKYYLFSYNSYLIKYIQNLCIVRGPAADYCPVLYCRIDARGLKSRQDGY